MKLKKLVCTLTVISLLTAAGCSAGDMGASESVTNEAYVPITDSDSKGETKSEDINAAVESGGAEDAAQRWCRRCAVYFFVRLYRNPAVNLSVIKGFLCKMTGKEQADVVPSRQAVFVRCCLSIRKTTRRRTVPWLCETRYYQCFCFFRSLVMYIVLFLYVK